MVEVIKMEGEKQEGREEGRDEEECEEQGGNVIERKGKEVKGKRAKERGM